ncbi:hypothetical protein GQ54DRAFT_171880 [Martensiomyces pterosporus]|nr:hypothetical protein GQ54DRAFT_171880 [Martensiomyces pterosporus]
MPLKYPVPDTEPPIEAAPSSGARKLKRVAKGAAAADAGAQPPGEHRSHIRRKSTARDKTGPKVIVRGEKPKHKSHANVSRQHPKAHRNAKRTEPSDVWGHRSTREKLSLDSIRPSRVFENLQPKHMPSLHMAASHGNHGSSAGTKRKKKAKSPRKEAGSKHGSHRKHASAKDRPQEPAGTTQTAMPMPVPMSMPMPTPADPSMAPGPGPLWMGGVPTQTKATPAGAMQTTAILRTPSRGQSTAANLPPSNTSGTGAARAPVNASLRLSDFGPADRPPVPVLPAIHTKPYDVDAGNDRSNGLSTTSNECSGGDSTQVYQVLGYTTSNPSANVDTTEPQSPVLVTIANDGSIVSKISSPSVQRQPSTKSTNATNMKSSLNPIRSPPMLPSEGLGIASSPSTTGSMSMNSQGASSFATAQLYTGPAFPEPPTMPLPPLPQQQQMGSGPGGRKIRKTLSEVSDIAVRKHLSMTSDLMSEESPRESQDASTTAAAAAAAAAPFPVPADGPSNRLSIASDDPSMADLVFSEWLGDAQSPQHPTSSIAQSISQGNPAAKRFSQAEAEAEAEAEAANNASHSGQGQHTQRSYLETQSHFYPASAVRGTTSGSGTGKEKENVADLISRSKRDFDEATSNALSSIALLVRGMRAMRKVTSNLEAIDSSLVSTSQHGLPPLAAAKKDISEQLTLAPGPAPSEDRQ